MYDFSGVTDRVRTLSEYVRLDGARGGSSIIEFVCKEDHYGDIPEPVPATRVLPDWYRNLAPEKSDGNRDESDGSPAGRNLPFDVPGSTVKRCMPFLDAMTMGWIVPLAGDVEFEAEDGDVTYSYDSSLGYPLLSEHDLAEVGGEGFPNHEWPILKIRNKWCMNVPEGYSVLVTAPMNRVEARIHPFSGVVDADSYFHYVHFPFMWTGGEYSGIMDAGTPIVQVIPFERDAIVGEGRVRTMTDDEEREQERTLETLHERPDLYRTERRQEKQVPRSKPAEER